MGSEQSQPAGANSSGFGKIAQNPTFGGSLDSGDIRTRRPNQRTLSDESLSTIASTESRPVSPPISVCSDSDLPYISYTDRPIGESPKYRNKTANKLIRASTTAAGPSSSGRQMARGPSNYRSSITGRSIVVVKPGPVGAPFARDPDMAKLQSIPQFLPVMRGTLTLPTAKRDPEVLERLQPVHLQNICSRLQVHMNFCANRVVADQNELYQKIRKIDLDLEQLQQANTERQKQFVSVMETFSKVRQISNQLSRCNSLLNHNLECCSELNNLLPIEDRLEPFIWKTD